MNSRIKILLLSFILFLARVESYAQCAMCNATAESSIDSGSTAAKGLNVGVLYLLLMPLLFGGVLYFLYLKSKK